MGGNEGSSLPTIYVGEGEPVGERIKEHYSYKDFWDWAVFFVASEKWLNKAKIKFLESRLLWLVETAKQCKLANGKGSCEPTLSEPDMADAESFLLDMLTVFPLLGLKRV